MAGFWIVGSRVLTSSVMVFEPNRPCHLCLLEAASLKLKQLCASNWFAYRDIFLFHTSLIRFQRNIWFSCRESGTRFQFATKRIYSFQFLQFSDAKSLSQRHQQVAIEELNLLFLALTPPEGSSSNLSALFSNLYPLLPNLKVSPNLWSCPSPFCLPVLSEAGHLLYSHPTRTDLALQSSEHLDGAPGHPRAPRWGTLCS